MNAEEVRRALVDAGYEVETNVSISVQVLNQDGSRTNVAFFAMSGDNLDLSESTPDSREGVAVHHQGMVEDEHNYFHETTVEGVLFRVVSMSEDPDATN